MQASPPTTYPTPKASWSSSTASAPTSSPIRRRRSVPPAPGCYRGHHHDDVVATLVTGLPPAPRRDRPHAPPPGVAEVVNVLKWVTPAGAPVEHAYSSVLPFPNLWERL